MVTSYKNLKKKNNRKGHKCKWVEYKEEKERLSLLKGNISATKLPLKKAWEEKEKFFL